MVAPILSELILNRYLSTDARAAQLRHSCARDTWTVSKIVRLVLAVKHENAGSTMHLRPARCMALVEPHTRKICLVLAAPILLNMVMISRLYCNPPPPPSREAEKYARVANENRTPRRYAESGEQSNPIHLETPQQQQAVNVYPRSSRLLSSVPLGLVLLVVFVLLVLLLL